MAKSDEQTIDILAIEHDQNLPHWLSPQEQFKHQHAAIRERHRKAHEAKLNAKREAKRRPQGKLAPLNMLRRPAQRWAIAKGHARWALRKIVEG